jgi:hypothetical protein
MHRFCLVALGVGLLLPDLLVASSGEATRVGGGFNRAKATVGACGWRPVKVPAIAGLSLNAVFARSADDVWMVGSQGDEDRPRTLALHFDGRSLRVVRTPNPAAKKNVLQDVVAFGAGDAWAVGEGVARKKPVSHYVPLVMHYDGMTWQHVSAPTVNTRFGASLRGIDGSAANDVWAVGSARREQWVGYTIHWDGQRWRVVPSPRSTFNAVAALASYFVWAAGTSFTPSPNLPTANWDGQAWRLVKDAARSGAETYLNDVSASGPTNVWIVGQEAAGPFVERFNGRGFVRLDPPNGHWAANYSNQENSYFEGVAAITPTNVWAVGTFGIEHYDGRQLTLVSRNNSFWAIAAATPTDLWAVGGYTVWRYTCA